MHEREVVKERVRDGKRKGREKKVWRRNESWMVHVGHESLHTREGGEVRRLCLCLCL